MATKYHDLSALTSKIEDWHRARNLVEGSTRKDQVCKLLEEFGELSGGVVRNKEIDIQDAIGDMYVVLVLIALQSNVTIDQCIAFAYNEIKDRKGRMVDGVFVKEGE